MPKKRCGTCKQRDGSQLDSISAALLAGDLAVGCASAAASDDFGAYVLFAIAGGDPTLRRLAPPGVTRRIADGDFSRDAADLTGALALQGGLAGDAREGCEKD